MGFLKLIGAVSAAEHEREIEAGEQALRRMTVGRDDWKESSKRWECRFKNAISDLAAAQDELTAHKDAIAVLKEMTAQDAETIAALRPDAQKWRDRAARELQRGQAKRGKGK